MSLAVNFIDVWQLVPHVPFEHILPWKVQKA